MNEGDSIGKEIYQLIFHLIQLYIWSGNGDAILDSRYCKDAIENRLGLKV